MVDPTRCHYEKLLHYLERTNGRPPHDGDDLGGNDPPGDWPRVECCNSSRSLYCPECCTVLIPPEYWPPSIRNGTLTLPFTFDIVLDVKERRTSSTGIQIMAICNSMAACSSSSSSTKGRLTIQQRPNPDDNTDGTNPSRSCDSVWWRDANLYDLSRSPFPQYNDHDHPSSSLAQDSEGGTMTSSTTGTYVLFPQKGKSIPISSVAHKIKRLVVLDIKWSKLGLITTNHPSLSTLPFVHLDDPPPKSHFWRWHNAGDGMVSTAEAVYYASMEVGAALGWSDNVQDGILDLMWLFALQRSVISRRNVTAGIPVPYSDEGKAQRMAVRMRKDGKDQAARERRAQRTPFYDDGMSPPTQGGNIVDKDSI